MINFMSNPFTGDNSNVLIFAIAGGVCLILLLLLILWPSLSKKSASKTENSSSADINEKPADDDGHKE